eukprot:TRINITY_DN40329_c0_g1_i1.p1 TRINITY_DN40329_c0_g1~~TRINITY_DN40329_c0_g1_i1.p1  ORF type:complete len:505 (+),score=128.78 TRINITY_DN40329_c0_g1_i1:82-1515(+)
MPDSQSDRSDDDEGGGGAALNLRGLKAMVADPATRRVAFPQSEHLANLPLIPPTPPQASARSSHDSRRSTGSKLSRSRTSSKPSELEVTIDSRTRTSSKPREQSSSKLLDRRKKTASKGKVQMALEPGEQWEKPAAAVEKYRRPGGPQYIDGCVPGLPGVTEEVLEQAFREIDFDESGFLDVNELRYLLTVCGEEPTDAELDEMLAMLSEGDGQVSYDDFRTLFGPNSAVLAQLCLEAPAEGQENMPGSPGGAQDDDVVSNFSGRSHGIPNQKSEATLLDKAEVGNLLKGISGFIHATSKKEQQKERQKRQAKPKNKAPGMKHARPVLTSKLPPHGQMMAAAQSSTLMPGQGQGMQQQQQQMEMIKSGTLPPVPGHLPGMPPLPPGYLAGMEKAFLALQAQGQIPGQAGMMGGMGAVPGAPGSASDPLLAPSATQAASASRFAPPPKTMTFTEYQDLKFEHEEKMKQAKAEAEEDEY